MIGACATCVFWHGGFYGDATNPNRASDFESVGACRLRPPQVFHYSGGLPTASLFPMTHADAGCGHWVGNGRDPDGPDDGERQPAEVVPIRREAA